MGEHMKEETKRLLSLDIFRGLVIILMLIVNNSAGWCSIFHTLNHSKWNGCSLADVIFPAFLVIMGISISLSMAKFNKSEQLFTIYKRIILRTLILFSMGFFINLFPLFNFANVRIFGVLQRIAICYFFTSIFALNIKRKFWYIFICFFLLGLYWILMAFIPFEGKSWDIWSFGNNFAQYIDNIILRNHIGNNIEAEGLLSTLPAIINVIFGYLVGELLRSDRDRLEKGVIIFIIANICVFLCIVIEPFMPINKKLWTVSFAFLTIGVTLNVFSILYYVIDIKGFNKFTLFFKVFGCNSIIVYFASSLISRVLESVDVGDIITIEALNKDACQAVSELPMHFWYLSLLFPIVVILILYIPIFILYKKKKFIRV